MMSLKIFTALLLLALASAAPASNDDDEKVTVTKEYYINEFVKYQSEHDIVNIIVPLNSFNFDEDESSESESKENDDKITIFFVEADIDENGGRTYRGLYSLKEKNATLVLANGRDAASSADSSKTVYFAASDGLYTYIEDGETAIKYGSIDDSLIGIAHVKEGNGMYVLTEDNTVYEVKDNGNQKVKIDDVVNAQQIVLDFSNNLYFYTPDKKVFVRTSEGVKEFEGLPQNRTKVSLIRPPFILDDGVPILVDNVIYLIYSNGTSEESGFDLTSDAIPTAFATEAALIQYYGYEKKIYEYNLLLLLLGEILEELKNFLNTKTNDIQSLASNKRASLRSHA